MQDSWELKESRVIMPAQRKRGKPSPPPPGSSKSDANNSVTLAAPEAEADPVTPIARIRRYCPVRLVVPAVERPHHLMV